MPPVTQPAHAHPDVLIAGAGIIGLSLALELRRRGAAVTILESKVALRGASIAAAGMLAAEDPHNPLPLLPLSRYSLSLYPDFLAQVEALSGQAIPFQTSATVQYHDDAPSETLAEHSLDPRQLAPALLTAALAASVHVIEHTAVIEVRPLHDGLEASTTAGQVFRAAHLVHTTGAWSLPGWEGPIAVSPRKGQMLRVAMPADAPLTEVHRAQHVYAVPRTTGPQAGTALIGATVEDAGFDLSLHPAQLAQLRADAAALAPATSFAAHAPMLEAWAGLRPSTLDFLPLIGPFRPREWVATGHFRNGILLAPGTAHVLADLILGQETAIDLGPFSAARFLRSPTSHTGSDIRPSFRDNAQ